MRKKNTLYYLIGTPIYIYLLEKILENYVGTFYSEYIEPYIMKSFYVVFSVKELLDESGQVIASVPEKFIRVNAVLLIAILIGLISLAFALERMLPIKRQKGKEAPLEETMQSLVNDMEFVQAAQTYRYKIERWKGKKRITIDYIGSKFDEGLDLNAVIHEEFAVDERKLKTLKNFLKKYDQFQKTGRNADLKAAKKQIEPLLSEIYYDINKLDLCDVKEEHCVEFAIYKGVQCLLGEEEWYDPIPGCSREICSVIRDSRKTRFLPALLMNTVFTFINRNSPLKQDRLYMTFAPEEKYLPAGYHKTLVVLTMSYKTIRDEYSDAYVETVVRYINEQLKQSTTERRT